MSLTPHQVGRDFSSYSRVCSLPAKATNKKWLCFMSAKKCFLRISGTSTRRCRLSSPSSNSALLRLLQSFWIHLLLSPLPRWSTLEWMPPTHISRSHGRRKCASTTVPDSNEESDNGNGDDDDDYEEEEEDEYLMLLLFSFPFLLS
jgi:hypothetical protein